MVTSEVLSALAQARRHISREVWFDLTDTLLKLDGYPRSQVIGFLRQDIRNPNAAWFLSEALDRFAFEKWSLVASAMIAVDHYHSDDARFAEFIWSGPANGRFPIRRIDQVLYDLIQAAKRQIFLISFAAYRIDHLCNQLSQAMDRGVQVVMLLENEQQSEGQLSADAIRAFENLPLSNIKLLYWPTAKRERNQAGRPGKLHAKAAIVDDVAVISSANLTDDAFNRNMELGILLKDREEVLKLVKHFEELERWGTLRQMRI